MRPLRWRIAFLGIACLVVLLLGIGGWRLAVQEQSIARERTRERLENAASLIVRECERALARVPPGDSLSLEWDDGRLRRTDGVPLLWSPLPPSPPDPQDEIFAAAETMEFGARDHVRAIGLYLPRLAHRDPAVRAGALLRIARCERNLGRIGAALRTYELLGAFGDTPTGGAPAGLVALHERAVLLERSGSPEVLRVRGLLRAALETGHYRLDRATFAFYSRLVSIPESAQDWAEAAGGLMNHADGYSRGSAIITVRGRRLLAEWSGERNRGTGRLVEIASVQRAVAEAVRMPGLRWQFLDETGRGLAEIGPQTGGPRLVKRSAETGLPWAILVRPGQEPAPALLSPVVAALLLAGVAILAALFLAYRAVERQLHLAHMQSGFVAAVSHEFRTPIAVLGHMAEMLETGGVPDHRKRVYYATLGRETARLRELVEGLLDFGRIESGHYRYRSETLDLVEFVRALADEFRGQGAASAHEIVFEATGEPPPVSADRATLRRAVWNLLENAVKYSPPGKRVAVRVAASGNGAAITVRDEGPGIPAHERRAIFQKFVRGAAARDANIKGTGIGLALVDAIVRAHGGRVELDSQPGEGSHFTIVLPAEVGS